MFRSQTLEWRCKLVWRKSKSQKDDTLIDDPVELAKVDMLLSRDDCEVMCFYDMAVASSIFSRLRFMFSLAMDANKTQSKSVQAERYCPIIKKSNKDQLTCRSGYSIRWISRLVWYYHYYPPNTQLNIECAFQHHHHINATIHQQTSCELFPDVW